MSGQAPASFLKIHVFKEKHREFLWGGGGGGAHLVICSHSFYPGFKNIFWCDREMLANYRNKLLYSHRVWKQNHTKKPIKTQQ